MPRRPAASDYDDLLQSHYGTAGDRRDRRSARSAYGARSDTTPARAVSLSLGHDDGEILAGVAASPEESEYVVESPRWNEPVAAPTPPDLPLPAPPAPPLPASPGMVGSPAGIAPQEPAVPAAGVAESLTEDDILADMQRILSGNGRWDPTSGTMQDGPTRPAAQDAGPTSTPQLPQANEHAFFDALAASMEYANTYDLGSMELRRKFDDFDRAAQPPQPAAPRPPPAIVENTLGNSAVGNAEFIQDLDAIHAAHDDVDRRRADLPSREAACAPVSMVVGEQAGTHSLPMYDTGEHVLAGDNLYADALTVGPAPGVRFSYGQLVAMADFCATPEAMMATPVAQLATMRRLIERSTAFYSGGKRDASSNVAHAEWDAATNGEYLRLAQANYEHFAPHTLPVQVPVALRFGNHKDTWEFYHRSAIEQAQQFYRTSDASGFPERAVIRNAFGDHFLTDAFAAGHLFNKEAAIAMFKANFFSATSLNAAANRFFDRLAEKAFVGKVRQKFSTLETAGYPVCAAGWCLRWHPDINSPSRFASLLKEAAVQEPEKIANFAVKALHDHLNQHGLRVTNGAGDGEWTLLGDEHLTAETTAIMRRAVKQSADSITDPAIRASGVDYAAYFAKVWKHVPRPTPSANAEIMRLMTTFTDPDSALLVTSAAKVLTDNLDTLIGELLERKKLQPA
ncbi:hypothetical protein AB0M36_17175 [Actinoplanes sp. NPDC051346]|uniref:hypothetical protein n=1 Tax=Actinoplanes sp. NPDC051346 TaxID=3155048 RepID=UPI0034359BBC